MLKLELPFKVLLIAILLSFSIIFGLQILNKHESSIEKMSAEQAFSTFLSQYTAVSFMGTNSKVTFKINIPHGYKLIIYNLITGNSSGALVELGEKGSRKKLEPLPLPANNNNPCEMCVVAEISSGRHKITLINRENYIEIKMS